MSSRTQTWFARCRPGALLAVILSCAGPLAAADPLPGGVDDLEAGISVQAGVPQLFVDDQLIADTRDLHRTLHQPRKDDGGRRPLITADPGTTLLAYGSIVQDPKLKQYVMFIQEFPSRRMYRLLSPDGLTWPRDKRDGCTELRFDPEPPAGRPRDDAVYSIDVFTCWYDASNRSHPYQGWLYYANCGNECEGDYHVRSKDGITWEIGRLVVNAFAGPDDPSSHKIQQDGRTVYGPGDVTLFAPDPENHRFLGLFKFFTTEKVGPGSNLRSRAYAYFDRLDEPFDAAQIRQVALLPPVAEVNGNQPDDEFYAATAWRYGDLWMGDLKVWHRGGDYPFSAAGCAFLKLLVSRDGLHWSKVPYDNDQGVPEVFVANGPEGGNDGLNDGGYMTAFSQGPLRIGDELVYYYSSSSWGKNHPREKLLRGGGIFRSRLRVDGFVSVDRGRLTTHPLKPTGTDLLINAVGPVRVEMVNVRGAVVGSADIKGDSLAHAVRFDDRSFRALAGDGPVQLRFTIGTNGRLYSFTMR